MKTPQEIANGIAMRWVGSIYDAAEVQAVVDGIVEGIEADRAQRRVTFDALDAMLAAWNEDISDVPAFIQAWADHFNEGQEVPEWATA